MSGQLQNKLENALNEARVLILGGHVLIGAAFRLTFIDGFDKLPIYSRGLHLGSLWLMLLAWESCSSRLLIISSSKTGRIPGVFMNSSPSCWNGHCFHSLSGSASAFSLWEKRQ